MTAPEAFRGIEIRDLRKSYSLGERRVEAVRGIDLDLHEPGLCAVMGPSGSGKSSLAFDTLYAEGQRRYIETFSSYARQFLGRMERPDVDVIEGLSPVIAIEQKTTNRNPRSTVGTVTEVYDFLRLLYARTSTAYSMTTGQAMVSDTEEGIQEKILQRFSGKRIAIMSSMACMCSGSAASFIWDP